MASSARKTSRKTQCTASCALALAGAMCLVAGSYIHLTIGELVMTRLIKLAGQHTTHQWQVKGQSSLSSCHTAHLRGQA